MSYLLLGDQFQPLASAVETECPIKLVPISLSAPVQVSNVLQTFCQGQLQFKHQFSKRIINEKTNVIVTRTYITTQLGLKLPLPFISLIPKDHNKA